jgi:hypothetical protein
MVSTYKLYLAQVDVQRYPYHNELPVPFSVREFQVSFTLEFCFADGDATVFIVFSIELSTRVSSYLWTAATTA